MDNFRVKLALCDLNAIARYTAKWLEATPAEVDCVNNLRFGYIKSDLEKTIAELTAELGKDA